MRRNTIKRMITAGACALMLALGASQPSFATPPGCEYPSLCEWELECFYMDEDGDIVWSCRFYKHCYC